MISVPLEGQAMEGLLGCTLTVLVSGCGGNTSSRMLSPSRNNGTSNLGLVALHLRLRLRTYLRREEECYRREVSMMLGVLLRDKCDDYALVPWRAKRQKQDNVQICAGVKDYLILIQLIRIC